VARMFAFVPISVPTEVTAGLRQECF
jgi:hypothetical protein